jgi:hypothetical protein
MKILLSYYIVVNNNYIFINHQQFNFFIQIKQIQVILQLII